MKPAEYPCDTCETPVPQNPGVGRIKRSCSYRCSRSRYRKHPNCIECGQILLDRGKRCPGCTPKPVPRELSTGYRAIHQRIVRTRGVASSFTCPCGNPAEEWSYNKSGADRVVSEWQGRRVELSVDIFQYDALCKSCHVRRDAPLRKKPTTKFSSKKKKVSKVEPLIGSSKVCSKCKNSLDLSLFYTSSRHRDGRTSYCRACSMVASKQRYHRVKHNQADAIRESALASYHNARVRAVSIYGGRCVSCDEAENLHFDHVNGGGGAHRELESHHSLYRRISRAGRRLTDIDLQLLCVPCHRSKSAEEMRSWHAANRSRISSADRARVGWP